MKQQKNINQLLKDRLRIFTRDLTLLLIFITCICFYFSFDTLITFLICSIILLIFASMLFINKIIYLEYLFILIAKIISKVTNPIILFSIYIILMPIPFIFFKISRLFSKKQSNWVKNENNFDFKNTF